MELKNLDINQLLTVLEILGTVVLLLGVKMKWWKASDFKIARPIIEEGIKAGLSHDDIASKVSSATKLNDVQALTEIREVVTDLKGDKKPLSKRIQRVGRKLLWRIFDGGL